MTKIVEQPEATRLQRFAALHWYDGLIEFAFRFVAKTSEPLLALGLTVSAADYLSHGAVMAGHPAFSLAWAWAQALALESSSGVVFVYSLSAFRQADKVKGAIYLVLALMLAIVGGGMLLLQVNATTMGSAENAVPVLNVLRVIVSIAYIFLLRAKSIRFTDLSDTREQPAPVQAVQQPALEEVLTPLIERLDERYSKHLEAIVERTVERVSISIEQQTAPHLTAIAAPKREAEVPHVTWNEQGTLETVQFPGKEPVRVAERLENDEPIYQGQFASKEAEIAAILQERPGATAEEIAQEAGCTVRTAVKWISKLQAKED